jgi:pimeloyl-ACP methyl ester carboxylesterase
MNVALVGGFGAPPALLVPLRNALRREGHHVGVAPLGFNVDCGETTVQRLEAWLEAFGAAEQVALVGHSRGGQLGRVIAARRPDLVTRLVTVATPWSIGPPDRVGVAQVAAVVRAARRVGIDVMGSIDCATGECCARYRADLVTKPSARWTAVWSSTDRFAGGDSRPPAAADDALDVRTSHAGAVTSRRGIDAIAAALR